MAEKDEGWTPVKVSAVFGVARELDLADADWYALSFADDTGFLGGAYVRGADEGSAWARSHLLGINPGGEVQILGPLPAVELEANVPELDRERLLSRAEWA